MLRLLTLTMTVLAMALSAVSTALAVPPLRYASATGTPAKNCASPATACDLVTAINGNNATAGDRRNQP